jgi:uncharacterized protein (TIGR02186 family)
VTAAFRTAVTCVIALSCHAGPVAAEKIVFDVEPAKISVTSNYGGRSIVVFGVIQASDAPARPYDIVVTVTGPRRTVVVRRKERVAGVWVNQGGHAFADVPAFLGVFSNRPIDAIASKDTLRQQRIGTKNILVASEPGDEDDPYLANLLGIELDDKLYNEQSNAVTFLSSTLFRAEVPLPANVPSGSYAVDLKLFSKGTQIAQTSSMFNVAKVGIEEFVARAAVDHSLAYGLATMAMALTTGWLASIAFRRD